jgi:uncharacterized protein (TIGR03382 family)
MKTVSLVVACAGMAVASNALAQVGSGGTINQGSSTFTIADYPTVGTGNGNTSNFRVNDPAGVDHAFQTNWWFRTAGASRETLLNSATSSSYTGNVGQASFLLAANVPATLVTFVEQTGVGRGRLTQTLVVTNNTSEAITLDLFNYTDLDVNNAAGGNNVSILNPTLMQVSRGDWTVQYSGIGATAYQNTAFSTLRGLLTNASVNNLDNTPGVGSVIAPQDFTGAFQWSITIDPGFSRSVTSSISVIPTPGAAALLGLGALAAGRRRR